MPFLDSTDFSLPIEALIRLATRSRRDISGPLDLPAFEQHSPQIQALVEAVVDHPRVKAGTKHKPFFVTTGEISLPVLNRVKNLNVGWKQRKYEPLTLIGGQELLTNFAQLSGDFWPIEPPQVRAFLGLYLAKGKGDFDRAEYAKFLHELLTVEAKTPKTKIARRLPFRERSASRLTDIAVFG